MHNGSINGLNYINKAYNHHKVLNQDPKDFALPVHLNPVSKNDYSHFVDYWTKYFENVQDEIDLERGLNNVFEYDWCPDVKVLEQILLSTRKLNSFATAVRTLEAVQFKTNDKQYKEVIEHLNPIITKLGIPKKEDLGAFNVVRVHNKWVD